MFPVVEADRYDFTCKLPSVPVFIPLKAPPASNRLKLHKRLLTSHSCQLDTHTHTHTSMHLHVSHKQELTYQGHSHHQQSSWEKSASEGRELLKKINISWVFLMKFGVLWIIYDPLEQICRFDLAHHCI